MAYFNGINIESPKTGFGELSVANNIAFIQAAPVNNYIPANFRTYTTYSGSADVIDRQFTVQTGLSAYGYGAIQSFRSLNYKAGQGGLARFTAVFLSGGLVDCWQGVGLLNIGDELSFGYNGTDFGIWYRHDGKPEDQLLTVTTAANAGQTATVTVNNVAYNVPLTTGTTTHNAFEIVRYLEQNITGWNVEQRNGNMVQFVASSDGDKTGTFSFSSTGNAVASFTEVTVGVTKTSDFILQSDWNVDTKPQLDPTKGNVYQIVYQYLGYGAIKFYIENPETGDFDLVHIIKYANKNVAPSIGNPSMRLGLYAASLGSTQNVIVKCASMAAFTQGYETKTRNPRSYSNVKTGIGTTLTNLLTIRNKRTVNGLLNQVEFEPILLTAFTESSKGSTVVIRANAVLAGETNFQNINSNPDLVTEYETTATTYLSGGVPLGEFVVPQNTPLIINLETFRIRIPPTVSISILGRVNSGAVADMGTSLVWYEDV